MFYRCNNCRCEFDEIGSWEEDRGEFWGTPCSETMYGCPNCYDTDIEEVNEDDYDDKELEG